MIKKHLRKIVCKPFQELKSVISSSYKRNSVRTNLRGSYDEKRFNVLHSQIIEILSYENNNGDRDYKYLGKIIERRNNMSPNCPLTPYTLRRLGKNKRKQAERYGFGPRLKYIVERFEEQNGITTFGAGFGANQERTEKEFEKSLGFQFYTDEGPAHNVLESKSMSKKNRTKEASDNFIRYLMESRNYALQKTR